MSIRFVNQRWLATPNNTTAWYDQARASVSFFIKLNSRGSVLDQSGIINLGLARLTQSAVASSPVPGGFASRTTVFNGASQNVVAINQFHPGVTHFVCVTWDADNNAQTIYIDGYPTQFGSLSGNTRGTTASPIQIGARGEQELDWEVSNLAIWNGYALDQEDVITLRSGGDPTAIGESASARWFYPLDGTPGSPVANGDAALADLFGGQVLGGITGVGSAAYSEPLVFAPAAKASELYVTSSGEMIGAEFRSILSNELAMPVAVIEMPTIFVNGEDKGQLRLSCLPGACERWLAATPEGVVIGPDDTAELSASEGWFLTAAGMVGELDHVTVSNRAGRSSVQSELAVKTLSPGYNASQPAAINYARIAPFKNLFLLSSAFDPAKVIERDENLQPTRISASPVDANLRTSVEQNGFDSSGYPIQVGKYAVGWDSGNTTFSLRSTASHMVVTEVTGLANPGSGGIGKVRVFEVSYAPGSTNRLGAIGIRMECPSLAPDFSGLVVYGPDDFAWKANTPTVLDKTDPFALSKSFIDLFPNGLGSLRWMDSVIDVGGWSTTAEPEELKPLTQFGWGNAYVKEARTIRGVAIRPWDPETSPYVYSDLIGGGFGGETFEATLAEAIDDRQTTIVISDAATAPVLPGLKLKIDDEEFRVLAVDGTNVVVDRGANHTIPAGHAAGPVTVMYRKAIDFSNLGPKYQIAEIVSQEPHGLRTCQWRQFSAGWPDVPCSDGSTFSMSRWRRCAYVTSATSWLVIAEAAASDTLVTMSEPITLDPGVHTIDASFPINEGIPLAAACIATSKFPNCKIHVCLPFGSSDAMVDFYANTLLQYVPRGREIIIEAPGNENWNWSFPQSHADLQCGQLFLGAPSQTWSAHRLGIVAARVKAIFGDRANELKFAWNNQQGQTGIVSRVCAIAAENNYPLDYLMVAPYFMPNRSLPVNLTYPWMVSPRASLDVFVHDVLFGTQRDGFRDMQKRVRETLAAFNAESGYNVKLASYEGFLDCVMPVWSTTITKTGGVSSSDTSWPVASTSGILVGMYLLCEAEWVVVTSVGDNEIEVERAQAGTSAASHAKDVSLRPPSGERNFDLMHDPLIFHAAKDLFLFVQRESFVVWSSYALAHGRYNGVNDWGAMTWPGQPVGRGDGSDGRGVNGIYRAEPGFENSRPVGVNLDEISVSVRQAAHQDWMKEHAAAKKPSRPGRKRLDR